MGDLTGLKVWTIYVSYIPSASKKHFSETEGMEERERRCVETDEEGGSVQQYTYWVAVMNSSAWVILYTQIKCGSRKMKDLTFVK